VAEAVIERPSTEEIASMNYNNPFQEDQHTSAALYQRYERLEPINFINGESPPFAIHSFVTYT
jgi:hypothetical protein